MSFEKQTPAFRSERIDELRQSVATQELSETESQQQKLGQFARKALEILDGEEYRSLEGSYAEYESDKKSDTTLHVSLFRSDRAVEIGGVIKGPGGITPNIGIYRITSEGEIFRADHTNSVRPGEAEWKKVSLTAKKDERRVNEVKNMVEAAVLHSVLEAETAEREFDNNVMSIERALRNITQQEMGDEPEDFTRLSQLLRSAVQVINLRPDSPVQALEIRKQREILREQLHPYGVSISDTEQVEGLANATEEITKKYRELTYDKKRAEEKRDKARDTLNTLRELRPDTRPVL